MMSFKDFVMMASAQGRSDVDNMKDWIILNDRESEMLTIVTDLAKSKVDKVSKKLATAQMWIPCLPDMREYFKGKDNKETALRLNQLQQYYCLGTEYTDQLIKWAKENIPNIDIPMVIFIPMVQDLDKKYGIRFKLRPDRGNPYSDSRYSTLA